MPYFRGVAAVLAVVLGGALLTLTFWKPHVAQARTTITPSTVPTLVAGCPAAGDVPQSVATQQALPGATIIERLYAQGNSAIDFTLVGATSRAGIHDPRLCLTGAGWRLSDAHAERLPGTNVTMQVCEAATQTSTPDRLIAYFYVVNGRIISSPTAIRSALLWSALLGRQSAPAYFVRFTLPLSDGADANVRQHAKLDAFAEEMWHTLAPQMNMRPG